MNSKMKHLPFWGVVFAVIHISHSFQEFCQLNVAEGEGTHFIFSVYYDPNKDQCNPFIYKGQGGNANRFQNERDCMRNCSSRAEVIYPMDESHACLLKKAIGGCNAQHLRYYYDAVHDKCKKFIWSGCIGNGNRFTSFESCNATCAGIHGEGKAVSYLSAQLFSIIYVVNIYPYVSKTNESKLWLISSCFLTCELS
ncbi:hypothetical protein INR49_010816 [Caranx melampygus]|nr:hypothetical protein INR49_010816 [Caranx melampygus]